jgi:hypothetical protein
LSPVYRLFTGSSTIYGRKSKVYFSVDKIIYYDINKLKIVNVVYGWVVHLWARFYGLNYEKAFCVISA